MTTTLWNSPLVEFDALVRSAFAPRPAATARRAPSDQAWIPAGELSRDGDDAVLTLELPGLDVTRDVHVELDRGRLVVHGERRQENGDATAGLRELRYGSFRRSFTLPAHVTADAISAGYDAGLLTVRIAGAHAGSVPEQIAITSGTAAPAQLAESAE
jgi:HSP20 family molecular chaperone IbpA